MYVSNESNYDVFFDNLQVIHTPGPILEETHYYPFGLTMAGISSKGVGNLQNKYKFNSGTELNTDLDINLYETNFRSLDAQIGRFWQVDPLADFTFEKSPYSFASNNPLVFNDPTGLQDSTSKETSTPLSPKTLHEVVVKSGKNNDKIDSWITTLGWAAVGIDSYKELGYKGDWMYRTSKGKVQSIFNTKWGANKSPAELGNISNYSKNARSAIIGTKAVKLIKLGGKLIVIVSTANDVRNVYNAWKYGDYNAEAIYAKAAVNTTMTVVGFAPGVGWVLSGTYFLIDATIGWENAIPSYLETEKAKASMREQNIVNFSDFKN